MSFIAGSLAETANEVLQINIRLPEIDVPTVHSAQLSLEVGGAKALCCGYLCIEQWPLKGSRLNDVEGSATTHDRRKLTDGKVLGMAA